ncbi:acetyltransferase [Oceanospirillaceae bacterium]|nr:acetyltransferase [Oceanospirillaceae bacterium]
MNKKLAVIGAGGHGKVVADIAEELGFDISFFDDAFLERTNIEHWVIRGTLLDFLAVSDLYYGAVVAIGNAKIRESIFTKLHLLNLNTPSIQHPSAKVSQYANIGHGCVIMPGAVINAFSTIGNSCIINSNAVVEHDCNLDDFVHMCPNATVAGGVTIGKRAWVGIGASIRQMITIGPDSFIGGGSAVVNDIPTGATVVGVPAKVLKKQRITC